jgi:hypothetical protein
MLSLNWIGHELEASPSPAEVRQVEAGNPGAVATPEKRRVAPTL